MYRVDFNSFGSTSKKRKKCINFAYCSDELKIKLSGSGEGVKKKENTKKYKTKTLIYFL